MLAPSMAGCGVHLQDAPRRSVGQQIRHAAQDRLQLQACLGCSFSCQRRSHCADYAVEGTAATV